MTLLRDEAAGDAEALSEEDEEAVDVRGSERRADELLAAGRTMRLEAVRAALARASRRRRSVGGRGSR